MKDDLKDNFLLILFCFVLAAGAFAWGYIWKDIRVDDLRNNIVKMESKQRDMNGRLTAVEGPRK